MAEPAIVRGRMKIFLTFLALLAALPAFAADPVVCGSTAEAQREAEEVARYVSADPPRE